MAREVHQREDLLREATALVPRVLLKLSLEGRDVQVFAGFRGAALSLYFGDDPVYHFTAAGELRRAFIGDRLIKAEQGRLVSLERVRSPEESTLLRRDLDADTERLLMQQLWRSLAQLYAALQAERFAKLGEEPSGDAAIPRLSDWLARHTQPGIAASLRL